MKIRRVFAHLLAAAAFLSIPAAGAGRTTRDSLGVNIHFTDPDPGVMDMLAETGMGWVRMDLAWSGTERAKGVYDFGHYDVLLANLDKRRMRALLILDYGSDIYGASGKPPYDDAGRAAFARWAVAAVGHFQKRRVLWELWNEPNGDWFWPNHNAGDYSKLALVVDKAIRNRFPHELLIGPATSGIDMPFLTRCFQDGCLDYWDAVSVHPYRQSAPETTACEYTELKKLIAQYAKGRNIPIVSGEWGYSVQWKDYTDERQAIYAVRQFLCNLENRIPLSIWYDWRNDGVDPANAEHNFGLTRWRYYAGRNPVYDAKPSYIAIQTLTSILGDFSFSHRVAIGDPADDHVDAFAKGRETRYAAWTASTGPRAVTLPLRPGNYDVVDILGKRSRCFAGKSGLPLTLTDTPVYIERVKRV
jgi:hypothetical protein